jgi:hypothetical protein
MTQVRPRGVGPEWLKLARLVQFGDIEMRVGCARIVG